jgi:hypothetical protein
MICDNADLIKKSAKSGGKEFVYQDYYSPMGMYHTKSYVCESHFYSIRNKYIV